MGAMLYADRAFKQCRVCLHALCPTITDWYWLQMVKSAARAAAADSGPHQSRNANGIHKSVGFSGSDEAIDDDM